MRASEVVAYRNDGIIFREARTLNSTLLHPREHHRSLGKDLLPVPLHEDGRAARQYPQLDQEGVWRYRARRYSMNGTSGSSWRNGQSQAIGHDLQGPW